MSENLIFKLSTISKTIQSALDFDHASKVKESMPVSGGSQIMPPIWPTRYCLENWIEALDQACAELQDKQWQPIETALRDGTRVLVYRTDAEHPNRVIGIDCRSPSKFSGQWAHSRMGELPTHWMPLPEPPEEKR